VAQPPSAVLLLAADASWVRFAKPLRGQRRSTLVNGGQPPSTAAHSRPACPTSTRPACPTRAAAGRWRKDAFRRSDIFGHVSDMAVTRRRSHQIQPLRQSPSRRLSRPSMFLNCPRIARRQSRRRRPFSGRPRPKPPHPFIPSHPQLFRQIPRKSAKSGSARIGACNGTDWHIATKSDNRGIHGKKCFRSKG
jgi:hypothetical protein